MSTISFTVLAHDLASRVFRGIGNAAMAMAAKVRAADAVAGRTAGIDRQTGALTRFRLAAMRAAPAVTLLNNGLNRLTGGNMTAHARLWFRVILTGLALMPAVVGPAVVALGALAGAIVSATPGVGALGLAMFGTWRRIRQVADGTRTATGPLRQAADAFNQMQRAYQGFLNRTQGPVANVFTQAFRGAAELLPRLVPLTNRFANVFSNFLRGIRRDMQSPAFDRALRWLRQVGSISFRNILESGKNLTTFFYNLARSFQRAGVDIKAGWLRDLTKGWSDWAKGLGDSPGFKRLIDFTKTQWPKIREIFGNMGRTLGNLMEGMEPISSKALDGLVKLTDALSKIKPGQWTAIGTAFLGLSVGIKALGIAIAGLKIAGMIRLFRLLGALPKGGGGTLGSLGRGLGALGAGLGKFVKGLGGFGVGGGLMLLFDLIDRWRKGDLAAPGKGGAGGLFSGFDNFIKGARKQIAPMREMAFNIMPKISMGGIGKALGGLGKQTLKVGVELATGPLASLTRLLSGFKNRTIKLAVTVATGALTTARRLWDAFKNKSVRLLVTAATGALGVARRLWDAFKPSKTVRLLATASVGAWNMAKRLFDGFKASKTVRLLATAAVGAWTRARSVLNGIRNKSVRLIASAAVGAWTRARSLLNGIRNRTVRLIAAATTGAWSRGKSLLNSIRNRTVRLLATATTSAWSRGKSLLLSIKNRTVRLIGTASTGAWAAAKSLLGSIRSKVVTITTVFRNVIKTITGKAAGGQVHRSRPYLVGEVGPELFVPETAGRIIPRSKVHTFSEKGGGGGGDTYIINVHGAIDPVATGREVQRALLALKRNNGGRALGLG